MKKLLIILCFCFTASVLSQNGYWQQHVEYTMEIDVDVERFSYAGEQNLVYTNNSPDTLQRVFYHLYYNAFKPGSDLEAASRFSYNDKRNMSKNLLSLDKNDWGDVRVLALTQDGFAVNHTTKETILEVDLNTPLLPGDKTSLDMSFFVKVPAIVRRAGKNNSDGIAFSMAQWYPKLCEYDNEGWHANPYIGREFYGVWGDFDVTINIDKDYTVAASGYLQNPEKIGHGYAVLNPGIVQEDRLSWRFVAPKVHDFTWAADPEYLHDVVPIKDGPEMHFFYKNETPYLKSWKDLQPFAVKFLEFFSKNIGKYPYKQYSVIMAGDGGMEYAMCTFITGSGYSDYRKLLGVTSHEIAHSWFQFLLATNESKHAWMDEGFTSYIDDAALNETLGLNNVVPNKGAYRAYFRWVATGLEEPLTTHADRYKFSRGYGASSYSKGSVFLSQLGYIIGEKNLYKTFKHYFNEWSFKHPRPYDFIRSAERVSGLELDWYLMDWAQTTKQLDYQVNSIVGEGNKTKIVLKRGKQMPMPIDLLVVLKDGSSLLFNIPLTMMRGNRPLENTTLLDSWSWAQPYYIFELNVAKENIQEVVIDPLGFTADVNRKNNRL
ncbi:MAG TPA: M1 family peptidase [Gammaproteobacteria bacterium]|nr:M1 family peptidase [Gammaproteobacteria bacterium]HIK63204.1 M1 family peptidase [Flavobacteriales bacterium]